MVSKKVEKAVFSTDLIDKTIITTKIFYERKSLSNTQVQKHKSIATQLNDRDDLRIEIHQAKHSRNIQI